MIKTIILTLCLATVILSANGSKEHKKLPYDLSSSLLEGIHSDAIVLGTGEKILYVFIDPLCRHSRKFIRMVSKNPLMLSKYKYHFLLYGIPRLKSENVISAVYMSENPTETLLKIMTEDKVLYDNGDATTKAKISRIATVGKEIDVYKRPYIFMIR